MSDYTSGPPIDRSDPNSVYTGNPIPPPYPNGDPVINYPVNNPGYAGNISFHAATEVIPNECQSCGKVGPYGSGDYFTTDDINSCKINIGNFQREFYLCMPCGKEFIKKLKKLLKGTLKG